VIDEDITTTNPSSPAHDTTVEDTPAADTHSVTSHQSTDLPPPEPVKVDEQSKCNIEFSFDTDVKCAITIYYFATEEISNKQAT
jgi:hypothetical protein